MPDPGDHEPMLPLDLDLATEVQRLADQVRQADSRSHKAEATAARAAQAFDELAAELTHLAAAAAAQPEPDDDEDSGGEIDLDQLVDWVDLNIGGWAQRKLARNPGSTGFVWCSQWWEHPEAITLLELLRRAWLESVGQPGRAMLDYMLGSYYPVLRTLSDPFGPFHACSAQLHVDSPFVPTAVTEDLEHAPSLPETVDETTTLNHQVT